MGRIWYNIWRFFAAGAIQRQDSLTNENAMTLGASGLRRFLCSEVNPVSERNYSSYSSQDESRPRSRSSSGRRFRPPLLRAPPEQKAREAEPGAHRHVGDWHHSAGGRHYGGHYVLFCGGLHPQQHPAPGPDGHERLHPQREQRHVLPG